MSARKPTYEQLEQRILELEENARRGALAERSLHSIERSYAETLKNLDKMCREIYSIRSMVGMPQIYLDENWNIVGYSADAPLLSRRVVRYTRERRNIREFFQESDFEKISRHLQKIASLENLPYDEGREWKLAYAGPAAPDDLERNWIIYRHTENCHWKVLPREGGGFKIYHAPHTDDYLDCCLMSVSEFGSEFEDIRLVYTIRTSQRSEDIRDLSTILSGSSGLEAVTPDMFGYTVCLGSNYNSEGRIQKHGANVITRPESLDTGSEYRVVIERVGGCVRRWVTNTATGSEIPLLEFIDSNAVYFGQNHIGFYTFSGEAEFYDLQVYTRQSRFELEQFRIPIDIEVGLRDDKLRDNVFRLKYAKNEIMGKTLHTLMLEDITKRKADEEALRESEEKYRRLFEESRVALSITTPEGRFLDVNLEMTNLFGYTHEEFMRLPADDLYINVEDRIIYLGVLERKGYVRDYELRMKRKDGSMVECLITSTVHRNRDGSVYCIQGSIQDTTERKRMEAQIKESQRMEVIGRLASGVAHEVRNPLNAILAITEALFQDIGDNPEYSPYLEHIRTQVDRLALLMKDLLELGKPLKRESFVRDSIRSICSEAIELWKQSSSLGARKVRLVVGAEGGRLEVFGNGSKLKQVVMNLLENAAQHSPEESEIVVEVGLGQSGMLSVKIRDRGTGISPELLPEVFKPFFTTRNRGAGLGLSIVKSIIETHGGQTELFNNDPGPGLTVEVTLPLAQEDGNEEKYTAGG
ncbi:PAS domain S-box protein [bacterium]|nr:PAS domain S-box protein [bacterium]